MRSVTGPHCRYLYYRSTGWDRGKIHRVDYDNPKSLAIKSGYAHAVGARGVGMWTADLIDYNESKAAQGFWDEAARAEGSGGVRRPKCTEPFDSAVHI